MQAWSGGGVGGGPWGGRKDKGLAQAALVFGRPQREEKAVVSVFHVRMGMAQASSNHGAV